MERKFKIGDRVCVNTNIHEYDGKNLCGKVGTVIYEIKYNTTYLADLQQYRVELAGLMNRNTSDGFFIFSADELILQEEMNKKDVLVGDMKNGYSFITAKEAAEIHMKFLTDIQPVAFKPNYSGRISNIKNVIFNNPATIKNVIFNNPATIVFWSDGSKTVVKCAGDEAFDEEKGLAMAISKKVLGNRGNYFNEFKKWLPEIEEEKE